jgi:hypothetical protein
MCKRLALFIVILILSHQLQAQVANRYDVVIDEIFPDPTPVVGLPDAEFIELKNVSSTPYNLRNWQISDGSSIATIKKDLILQPDSFVIICSTSSATAYSNFGTTIGVSSFPSLNNDGEVIFIKSPQGLTIHAISYDLTWYQNDIKSAGGWTLEMIDTKNPCTGFGKWKANEDAKGGTPGKKNLLMELIKMNTRQYC